MRILVAVCYLSGIDKMCTFAVVLMKMRSGKRVLICENLGG